MSRAFRIGSIYSRIEGLIRKNHLKKNNIPIWFDVYKQFPPKYNPILKREEPEMNVTEIFYKEDIIRSKIHKAFLNEFGVFDLQASEESVSQSLLKSCMDLISQGMSEDEAIEKLKASHTEIVKKGPKYDSYDSHDISSDDLKKILEGP